MRLFPISAEKTAECSRRHEDVALDQMRQHEPGLKVLYLTGYSDDLFADRVTLWQDEAFIDKPWATISCRVNARGTLDGCSIVSEEPGDMGFGDAAMKMSKLFKMRPQTRDGQPVDGGTVRIPIRFSLPKG